MDAGLAEELSHRGISEPRVLEAIGSLHRADFMPEGVSEETATGDFPYPIGYGQTISQPFVVAFMTQALNLRGDERVLEIGTGSGYQTAVLAKLCRDVYSIEIVKPLADQAKERLERLGFSNVHLRHGDGHQGWPEAAPFDVIIVTAAPTRMPQTLLSQLALGGRLLAPVGAHPDAQELILVEKTAPDGELVSHRLLPVRFVPMTSHSGSLLA